MAKENQIYSNSIHKLLRGLRRDAPDYTEDDCKQRVPKSGRVCINVRPIYSEPVIRFCPKYGCIYKRKIIGHDHDFLDLQTLKLTQVHQKNAYDGFWDVYDGPFKPSLSERRTLEDDLTEAGAAAGEPNKIEYNKKKERENAMRKQINTHAYNHSKRKRKIEDFDLLPAKYKPKYIHSDTLNLEKSIDQRKSKTEFMQPATSRANHDHIGTSKVRGDVNYRPIKANLEILTSLSLSYDNSDGSDKSAPAKLIHLALSWENNDYINDGPKNKNYQDRCIDKTELKQQASQQLIPDDHIDKPKPRDDIDKLPASKGTRDHQADTFKTIDDITQGVHKVNLAQISNTGLTDDSLADASNTKDYIERDANMSELLRTTIEQSTDDLSQKPKTRENVDNALNKAGFLQQTPTGQLIEYHSDQSKARYAIDNDARMTQLLQQASTEQLIEEHSHGSKTRKDIANVDNKAELLQLATTRALNDDHSGAAKTRNAITQGVNKAEHVRLNTIKVLNDDLSDGFDTRDIAVQSENNVVLSLATTRVLNDEHSDASISRDVVSQSNKSGKLSQLSPAGVLKDDQSEASKIRNAVVLGENNATLVELPYHLGISDISKEQPKTGIKSFTSFGHEYDRINASKTRHDVDNAQTENEANAFQIPVEADAVGIQANVESKDNLPFGKKDIDEDQMPAQNKISDGSENHIFDSLYYQEETVGEYVLISLKKHDTVKFTSDSCQTDNVKHLKNEVTTVMNDVVEDKNTFARSAENHISKISNLQKEIIGDHAPVTNVRDYELDHYNVETATAVSENDILINNIILESNSKMAENSTKYKDINLDECDEFMMGILGTYSRSQQQYIIDNIPKKCDDVEVDDDNCMCGLFGIFTRSS